MNIRRWIVISLLAIAAATLSATVPGAAASASPQGQHAYGQHDLQRDLAAITATGVPGVLAEATPPACQAPGTGIFFIPLSCGGGYWSHEGDVPGYNTIGAVSAGGRTTVVLSVNSNVDDPVLAAEYGLIDHVMCNR